LKALFAAKVLVGRTSSRDRSCRHRPGGHELLAAEIHAEVETFEPVRAEQHHVARLREYDN
jgi:hypothetical protein